MHPLRNMNEPVTIVRQTPTGDLRIPAKASVQSRKAYFAIDVDLKDGDLIEQSLANGKTKTYRATEVAQRRLPRQIPHIATTIEAVTTRPRRSPARSTSRAC